MTRKVPKKKVVDSESDEEIVSEVVEAVDEKERECIAAAEKYVSNCKKFEVKVDPSVVIALRTGWNILKPSKALGEGSLLPLMGILDRNRHITKINLEDVTMQDNR
jgi:hypothetical protein